MNYWQKEKEELEKGCENKIYSSMNKGDKHLCGVLCPICNIIDYCKNCEKLLAQLQKDKEERDRELEELKSILMLELDSWTNGDGAKLITNDIIEKIKLGDAE